MVVCCFEGKSCRKRPADGNMATEWHMERHQTRVRYGGSRPGDTVNPREECAREHLTWSAGSLWFFHFTVVTAAYREGLFARS